MSRCLRGPAVVNRGASPSSTARSIDSASATPVTSRFTASQITACCRRLHKKPGTSFSTRRGILSSRRQISQERSMAASEVCCPRITSRTGTMWAGWKKWEPPMRSG